MSDARRAMLAFIALVALLAVGCGDEGGDDAPGKDDRPRSATSADGDDGGSAPDTDASEGPTALPDPVPEGELPPIVVTSPRAFEELVGSFVLAGTATVHEGTLAWAILDARLEPMVQGRTTASCGAPCRGTFRVPVSLMKVPVGSWELHVWSPNASDEGPRRLHDTMVPITVAAKRTPGAPAPGAEPPGGAPQS